MRVVVDTNIAFSAILNSNSRISKIILQPKSKLNFQTLIEVAICCCPATAVGAGKETK